jgi:hypothetical protein
MLATATQLAKNYIDQPTFSASPSVYNHDGESNTFLFADPPTPPVHPPSQFKMASPSGKAGILLPSKEGANNLDRLVSFVSVLLQAVTASPPKLPVLPRTWRPPSCASCR